MAWCWCAEWTTTIGMGDVSCGLVSMKPLRVKRKEEPMEGLRTECVCYTAFRNSRSVSARSCGRHCTVAAVALLRCCARNDGASIRRDGDECELRYTNSRN